MSDTTALVTDECRQHVLLIVHELSIQLHLSNHVHRVLEVTWVHAPVWHLTLTRHGHVQRCGNFLRARQIYRSLIRADRQTLSHGEGQFCRGQRHQRTALGICTQPCRHTAQAPHLTLRTTVLDGGGEGGFLGARLRHIYLRLLPLHVVLLYIYTPSDGISLVAVPVFHILCGEVDVAALNLRSLLIQVHLNLTLTRHEIKLYVIHLWSLLQCSGVLRTKRRSLSADSRTHSIVERQRQRGFVLLACRHSIVHRARRHNLVRHEIHLVLLHRIVSH